MGKFELFFAVVLVATASSSWGQTESQLPRLVETIELPGVEGRIDHMDVDVRGQRLFLGALENNSLEVLDLSAGTVVKSIKGLGGPQGVAFVPDNREVFVAARDTGNLVVLDSTTFQEKKRFAFGDEADNLHFLPSMSLLILGYGGGEVAFIDTKSDTLLGTVPAGGHPEGLAGQVSSHRVFVNVPLSGSLLIIDMTTRTVVQKVSPAGLLSNFPITVQESHSRGAYYSHVPSQVTVFDTLSGRTLAQKDAPGDVDDLFFDDKTEALYLVSGSGRLELWSIPLSGPIVSLGSVLTGAGARTGLFSPELHRFFVAVPHRGSQAAKLLVFETQ